MHKRMLLSALAHETEGLLHGTDCPVERVTADSRKVAKGDLFVAVSGTHDDGASYVEDAIANGAAALCMEASRMEALDSCGLPLLVVKDARRALATAAAALADHPERKLLLVGVTGTLGKTSTVQLLEAALAARPERSTGVIGSLGAQVHGPAAADPRVRQLPDFGGMTTPDPVVLFDTLSLMADVGVEIVAMEVTSHALAQQRVQGLSFHLGIITNIVPDEHLEYHGTAEDYLATKSLFFEHLEPGAPVVVKAGDDHIERMIAAEALLRKRRPVVRVTTSLDGSADVSGEAVHRDTGGATFVVRFRRHLPAVHGHQAVTPCDVPVVLPVLGVQQVANATLAVTAAVMLGTPTQSITEGIAELAPITRRMQVVRESSPAIIDDTTGNPESLNAVFDTIAQLPRGTLRIVFGIRGSRGRDINEGLAATLAQGVLGELARSQVRTLITSSEDVADERNRVSEEEQRTVLETLSRHGTPYEFWPRLDDAVAALARECQPDDLVLLLGAQGMNSAATLLMTRLGETSSYISSSAVRS